MQRSEPLLVDARRPEERTLVKKPLLLACAWISFAVAFVGAFVPVLPTTPLLLLATFLFAKSSPRCHAWICRTKIYQAYVVPFKEQGGIPLKRKLAIIGISFGAMGLSAYFVQKPIVWVILAAVAVFLLYLMLVRIPTVEDDESANDAAHAPARSASAPLRAEVETD